MLKLYKLIDNKLHYWETWDKDDKTGIVHWGIVGERGQDKEVKSGLLTNFRKSIQKEIDEKVKDGYSEFDEDNIAFLEIEYIIDGFGTDKDLDKRHRLEEKMDEVLGWTGLGHTDGGSIGSGTMEVGCVVVDFDIAKKVIEHSITNTEFSDYSRIFKMDTD
ncbi:WGR domain-containing protein [Ferruginibacter albus]|uniref:WGR domain-containing protein n=1 Tax=Ferruginibacter albus TaxID=2875540 RepID=UPI001CC3F885|nr:WGR domain-containing protein [Ferruginibacter albus]UAY52079.1 WGR domain-containing protein [Ferruginibacter albus]